jgi:hypothetical protein
METTKNVKVVASIIYNPGMEFEQIYMASDDVIDIKAA